MASITVNGRKLRVSPGTTLLEVCRSNGIDIPTLCYDDELRPVGSCRMCLVEVRGRATLQAACVTPCEDGMVVETESPRVVEARKLILELLLARHEGNCLVCEKNGNCKLQDYCYRYGVEESPFKEGHEAIYPVDDPNPFIERDYNKCIMCTLCVRACESITGARAIGVINRGHAAKVATAFDRGLALSPCVFCGQCVMVCPTGALISKLSRGRGRSYQVRKVLTTCGYCGTGCTLELNVKDNRVVGVTSNRSPGWSPVNRGALCVKGRFGWDFIHSPERLTTPLIREDGDFREATWDEALDLVASRLRTIKETYGSDSIAVFTSSRTTNEENYLAQKFARAVLGTNNVDNCARL